MVVLFWPKYSPGNCSPEGWEWKVAVGTLTQHRKDFLRTVGESHIGGSHEGVQTWKPKGAVTKGFPQRSESQDSHSRVPQGHSPRRELTAVIQWQGNPCIYYCYLWCATAPNSLFLADYKANELSYRSLRRHTSFFMVQLQCLQETCFKTLLVQFLSLWNYLPLCVFFISPFFICTDQSQTTVTVCAHEESR